MNRIASLGSLTVDDGTSSGVVTVSSLSATNELGTSSQTFWHLDSGFGWHIVAPGPSGAIRKQSIASHGLGSTMETAIKALSLSGISTYKVLWSATTGRYTFSWASHPHTLVWTSASARALFGFSADSTTPATSHVSDVIPTYVLVPRYSLVSDPSPFYEPNGIVSLANADNGESYGLARTESPQYVDFEQRFEPPWLVNRPDAEASAPWTLQHLFEHCRTVFPFAIWGGGFSEDDPNPRVMMLRPDGARFRTVRASVANGLQLHVPFRCQYEGDLVEYF